jgi:hypothetical protein
MVEEIVGSHMRSDAFYGQNGSAQPSSIRKGDAPVKRSAVVKSIIAPDGAVNPKAEMDFQTRPVSAEQKVPTTFGMKNPNANPERIPNTNSRPVKK